MLNGPTMWPADGNHLVGPAPEARAQAGSHVGASRNVGLSLGDPRKSSSNSWGGTVSVLQQSR